MTLVEFLRARQDDLEARYRYGYELVEQTDSARAPGWMVAYCWCGWESHGGLETVVVDSWHEHAQQVHDQRWVLAEVDANRRIVALHTDGKDMCAAYARPPEPCPLMALLALPYAGHDDYRPEWRPDAGS